MNPNLSQLQPYPFEKLAALKAQVVPTEHRSPLFLSMGEPQHQAPDFIQAVIDGHLSGLSKYPLTKGSLELRTTIADWLRRRFQLTTGILDPELNILPVNGTREALFSIAQCIVDPQPDALVLMPNPFYQIYEGAALLAGAKPYFLNVKNNDLMPDYDAVPEKIWRRCQLLYLCSPGNPTGAVISLPTLHKLIELAQRYNFVIAADECYSEIYFDEAAPPPGLLQAAATSGSKLKNCLAFHSLSKRSSLPGMRSGFVAGDQDLIAKYLLYRTYHGCAMSPTFQAASIAAWSDEKHVQANRQLYREKFEIMLNALQPIMKVKRPDAGFYLWPETPIDDEKFAQALYQRYNLTVLPGSYLSRPIEGIDPGARHVRMALVATIQECTEAAQRLKEFMQEINR